jgi:hypothetical protein
MFLGEVSERISEFWLELSTVVLGAFRGAMIQNVEIIFLVTEDENTNNGYLAKMTL